ncbi:MAG: protein kinase [Labilithrix sp.]|nr:protein kinase [Labilithrix sp.]
MNPADPFGLVGQVLDGQFRVDQLVGEGGFSTVYKGHHQGLNEPIAIKCLKLPAALGTSLVDTFIQRFRDESRILYRLSQGNLHIVRSVAAGTTQAPATGAIIPYMVLEWLEGRSLQNDFTVRRTVGEKGRTLDEVVKLFDAAADGLAHAHAQGVVHRDLNPGNFYLATTPQGVKMKVLDFGVAKIMHDGALNLGPRAQTVGQIRIFAPAYGSPEQFDDRIGAVGAASDVYAFALVLLEALRDKTVNEGTHIGEFATATTDPNKRPTPRSLGVEVPDEVEAAFARATLLDPKARWQSVGDFWKSLTIAMKVASEHKYEQAARETPPLAIGARPPAPKDAKETVAAPMKHAGTLPLGTSTPGVPGAPKPGPRPRIPTTIGIPPVRPGAAPAPPAAPLRTTARPPSSPGMPGIPRPAARPPSDRPAGSPPTARFPSAPDAETIARRASEPPTSIATAPIAIAAAAAGEEEEATKIHAPGAEVLRTLALADAQAARAAVDRAIAGADVDDLADAARAAAPSSTRMPAAAPAPPPDAPARVTPVPPSGGGSGGTMMMAPGDAQAARSAVAQALAQQQQELPQPPPPPQRGGLGSTVAMSPPVPAPGMQGIPGARGTPPRGIPAVAAIPQPPPQQAPFGQASAVVSAQPLISHTPPAPFGTAQTPFAAAPPAAPFPPPSAPAVEAPAKPLPIVPIAIGLAVLAVGGLGLGLFALRARSVAPDGGVASAESAELTPTPVPMPTESPTEPATAPPVATEEVDATAPPGTDTPAEDASVAAAPTETPEPSAPPSASASAPAATAAQPTTSAPQFTWPPPTATPPPTASAKPAVDPNAWNEGAARGRLSVANGVLVFCKKEGGPTGPGNATVTFGTDGAVSGVHVDPPFAGTPTGDCVAAQLRRAKVNAFSGTPQTVRHSFEVPK